MHGISAEWTIGPTDEKAQSLDAGVVTLRLLNHDDADYLVSVQGVGDLGSYQSKLAGVRDQAVLTAGRGRELAIKLDGARLERLTHSGAVHVSFDACPVDDGACISGTSDALLLSPRVRPNAGLW